MNSLSEGWLEVQIGSKENQELNALAYLKAVRSELQLQEIYGLDEEIELAGGGRARLFQTLLASELHSAFFQSAYVQPFQKHYAEFGIVLQSVEQTGVQWTGRRGESVSYDLGRRRPKGQKNDGVDSLSRISPRQ